MIKKQQKNAKKVDANINLCLFFKKKLKKLSFYSETVLLTGDE